MPRIARELKPAQLRHLNAVHEDRPTTHAVGGVPGLLFQVTPNGGRSWVLRATIAGKRREFGLGSFPEVSLADAREAARRARRLISEGRDPSLERRQRKRRHEIRNLLGKTFSEVVDEYIPIKQMELKPDTKYRKQWGESIINHAFPRIQNKLVNEITTDEVAAVLQPIWYDKTETATKLQKKIKAVFDYAIGKGYREADNPATWEGKLKQILPAPSRVSKRTRYPAIQLNDIGRFWSRLLKRKGNSAMSLQFQALTATRTGAVRFMSWEELNEDRSVWTIQPGRESAKLEGYGDPMVVPLSRQAQKLLLELKPLDGCSLVFWSPTGKELSDQAATSVIKKINEEAIKGGELGFLDRRSGRRAVPHGFRSAFKDWSLEIGQFNDILSEMTLWHEVGTNARRAYARTELVRERYRILQEWANFIDSCVQEQNPPKMRLRS